MRRKVSMKRNSHPTRLMQSKNAQILKSTYSAFGVKVGVSAEEGREGPGLVPTSEQLGGGLTEETANVRA